MTSRLLAAAAVLAALTAPASASAHEGNPDYQSTVRTVRPPAPGVEVRVVNFDDRLALTARGHAVTIEGYDKEPYARVLRDGTVQVNDRSPARYLNDDRFAQVKVPPIADPEARPQWRTIDRSGRFEWHDHRAHWMGKTDPPQIKDSRDERTKIFDWRVPVAIDGQTGAVSGDLFWDPDDEQAPTGFIVAFGALIAAGLVAVVVVRRRRRRAQAEEPQEAW